MISNWKWFGSPGHFIGASDCYFHLTTQVGEYLISTVGEYFPFRAGVNFGERQSLGCSPDALFETKVFLVVKGGNPFHKKSECGCGMPKVSWLELESRYAKTAGEAQGCHMKMCLKYDKKQNGGGSEENNI